MGFLQYHQIVLVIEYTDESRVGILILQPESCSLHLHNYKLSHPKMSATSKHFFMSYRMTTIISLVGKKKNIYICISPSNLLAYVLLSKIGMLVIATWNQLTKLFFS